MDLILVIKPRDWISILVTIAAASSVLYLAFHAVREANEMSNKEFVKVVLIILLGIAFVADRFDELQQKYTCKKVTCTKVIQL